jgi:flagella basal body P-ring formation protein FlgA
MILLISLFIKIAIASEKPSVMVYAQPELAEQRVVYLSDVAQVQGFTATTKAGIEKIVLSLSPEEYQKKSKMDLLKTLRSELRPFEHECDCEIQLVFSRGEKTAQIKEFSFERVQKELLSRLQTLCKECVYQISNLNVMRGQVPKTFSKWSVQEDLRDLRGASMVRIYFDDQVLNPLVLQGWIRVQRPVIVLKKAATKGSVLTAADFELQTRDVTNDSKIFALPMDLVGRELKRSLSEAHMLGLEDLADKQVVRIGEPVAVEIQNGVIHLEMTGVAQKSGKVGDRIPIRITKTQKQIMAEIIADSRVRFE